MSKSLIILIAGAATLMASPAAARHHRHYRHYHHRHYSYSYSY